MFKWGICDLIWKFINAGVKDDMQLSEIARVRIINSSLLAAILNIVIYNISYWFIAPDDALGMSGYRMIFAIAILASWYFSYKGKVYITTHFLMIFSMLAVFQVSYKYLGTEYGFQTFFLIFAMIALIYFPKSKWYYRLLYGVINFGLFIYINDGNYAYLFQEGYKYYNSSHAHIFAYTNILIGFLTVMMVMHVFEHIIARDEVALKAALKSAKYHAEYDYLTGVLNRRSMSEILRNQIEDRDLNHIPLAIMMWDIDNFKNINDQYGHAYGDRVLKGICSYINNHFGNNIRLARWGGEEFIIIAEDQSYHEVLMMAEEIREGVSNLEIEGHHMTISVGVTMKHVEDSFSSLLLRVDELMYQAKSSGKNKVIND